MKTTLTISSRGIITIPKGLRTEAGIQPEETIIAETTPDGILLRPSVTLPIEMYSQKRVAEFDAEEDKLATAMHKRSKNDQ